MQTRSSMPLYAILIHNLSDQTAMYVYSASYFVVIASMHSLPLLYHCTVQSQEIAVLKEYYEIVDEACPLSGFFPHILIFFYGNAFLIMKLSKLPSFRVIRALIASQSTFEK